MLRDRQLVLEFVRAYNCAHGSSFPVERLGVVQVGFIFAYYLWQTKSPGQMTFLVVSASANNAVS